MKQNDLENSELLGAPQIEQTEILALLGRGGMATVFKARQILLERTVAIKVLSLAQKQSESGMKRFQREAKLSSSLDPPNIAKTLGFGLSKSMQPYLVMEYFEGYSLAEEIERRALCKKLPFEGQSALDTMVQHVRAALPSASEFAKVSDVPIKLASLILRGLEKDPANRPQSARVFAQDLNNVLHDITLDRSPHLKGTVKSSATLRKSFLIALVFCLASLGGF